MYRVYTLSSTHQTSSIKLPTVSKHLSVTVGLSLWGSRQWRQLRLELRITVERIYLLWADATVLRSQRVSRPIGPTRASRLVTRPRRLPIHEVLAHCAPQDLAVGRCRRHPWMFQTLDCCQSHTGVNYQQLVNEITSLCRYVLPRLYTYQHTRTITDTQISIWCPLLPYGSIKSARMSKITNDGLTQSDTGCFIAVPIWQHWPPKD